MNRDFTADFNLEEDEFDNCEDMDEDERKDGINHLFEFITGYALRRLNEDESLEENRALIFMAIDCAAKNIDEEEAANHILATLMGMGYFITEDELEETLSKVKEECVKEIMAYKIAVKALYELHAHPADVMMEVYKLLED